MIVFFAMDDNFAPLQSYLRHWGTPLRRSVCLIAYEDLPEPTELPNATFVFADIERMPPETAATAFALWETLAARGDAVRLLNHPGRSLCRYDLLRMLHQAGRNRFTVYRLQDPREALRYPVFVRPAREHCGASTPLLEDALSLERALADLAQAGHAEDDLLIVEFLDTSRDGLYRKYSATCLQGRILAHHIMFERKWEVKGPSLVAADMVAEERAYQESNPHERILKDIFHQANIDYGRIDYALADGQLQVWEINTNPTLLYPPERYHLSQMPAKRWFSDRLNQALRELDDRSPPCPPYRLRRYLVRHHLRQLRRDLRSGRLRQACLQRLLVLLRPLLRFLRPLVHRFRGKQ